MKVLRDFRRLVEAIEHGAAALAGILEIHRENGPAVARLDALELSQARWEAEVEAVLLKAEGKLQAANNSEARERTMRKSYEKFIDPLDEDSEEGFSGVRPGDAEGGESEGVLPLSVDLAPVDRKATAMNFKYPNLGG